jgi:hypothetical protein
MHSSSVLHICTHIHKNTYQPIQTYLNECVWCMIACMHARIHTPHTHTHTHTNRTHSQTYGCESLQGRLFAIRLLAITFVVALMHILMCINETLCVSECGGWEDRGEIVFSTTPACWQPARLKPAQIFRESALTANGLNQAEALLRRKPASSWTGILQCLMWDALRLREMAQRIPTHYVCECKNKINMCVCSYCCLASCIHTCIHKICVLWMPCAFDGASGTNVNMTYERATFNRQEISIYIGKMSVRLLSYELACPCWRCMPVQTWKNPKPWTRLHRYIYIYILYI